MSIASASAAFGCGRVDFDLLSVAVDAAQDGPGSDAGPSLGFVQSPGLKTNNDVGSTLAATFAKPVTPGNAVVAYTWTYAAGGQSSFSPGNVSDNAGNTYVLASIVTTSATGCNLANASSALAIYVATSVQVASPFTVTSAPLGPSQQEVELYIGEYAGVTAVDRAKVQQLAGSPSPMTVDTGPTTMPTTVANELVVAAATTCAGNPGTVGWTNTSGLVFRDQEIATTTTEPGIVGDQLVTAIGTPDAAWTLTYAGGQLPSLAALATLR